MAFQDFDPSVPLSQQATSPDKRSVALLRWRGAGNFSLRIQPTSDPRREFHVDSACGGPIFWSPSSTRPIALHATSRYVHANECQPAAYDAPTRQIIRRFGSPGTTFALSSDRRSLAYADGTRLWLQALSSEFDTTAPARLLTENSLGIDELRWSPDNRRIYFKIPYDDQSAPQVIELGPSAMPRAAGPRQESAEERIPVWSLTLDEANAQLRRSVPGVAPPAIPRRFGYWIDSYRYSPDGQWIAYGLRHRHSNIQSVRVLAVPVSGGAPIELSQGNDEFTNFTWAADSRHVLACKDGLLAEAPGLYRIGLQDGMTSLLTAHSCDDAHDPPSGAYLYQFETRRDSTIHRLLRSGGTAVPYLRGEDRIIGAYRENIFFEQRKAEKLTISRHNLRTQETNVWYIHSAGMPIRFLRQVGKQLLLFGTEDNPVP